MRGDLKIRARRSGDSCEMTWKALQGDLENRARGPG